MTHHFRLFFSNNYDGNKYISFPDLYDPRGYFFQNFRLIFIGPMKGDWLFLIHVPSVTNRPGSTILLSILYELSYIIEIFRTCLSSYGIYLKRYIFYSTISNIPILAENQPNQQICIRCFIIDDTFLMSCHFYNNEYIDKQSIITLSWHRPILFDMSYMIIW